MDIQAKPTFSATGSAASEVANHEVTVERTAAAFGLSAAVTILFNTVLAWVKDATPALNDLMKAATGHHWRTHGIVDVVVFFVLGYIFLVQGSTKKITNGLTIGLVISAVVAGAGLAAWFFLVCGCAPLRRTHLWGPGIDAIPGPLFHPGQSSR